MRLFLLIPSVRPNWAWRAVRFYLNEMAPHPFELRVIVAMQNRSPDPKGIAKLNECIDLIEPFDPSWVFTLADDTTQHPSLFKRLAETIAANPDARAIVFGMWHPSGRVLEAAPENCRPTLVGGGQVIWRRDFIGNHRFNYPDYGGRCDGHFIQSRYRESPDKFVFVNEPLTKFNSFEWEGVPA